MIFTLAFDKTTVVSRVDHGEDTVQQCSSARDELIFRKQGSGKISSEASAIVHSSMLCP